MAESNSSKSASASNEDAKAKSTQAVVEYLQAPRRKRKSYVILAAGQNIDPDTVQAIQRFMRTNYPKLSFITVRSTDDLLKYGQRNIVLAIIDDQLTERRETLSAIRKIKEQKPEGSLPTLFLTRDPAALVEVYHQDMPAWHEVDEYIQFADLPRHAMFRKIKAGIETKYQRRGRRYKVSMPVHFQILDSGDKKFLGSILDFSIHGALLSVQDNEHHFTARDQILIHIPLSKYIKGESDIFKVSAKVRRVLISGDKAGVSWEYVSEEKLNTLTRLLLAIVDTSLAKSANITRSKIAQTQAAAQPPHSSTSQS